MAVLIIFPVILQTVINLIMLSIGGQGNYTSGDKILATLTDHDSWIRWRTEHESTRWRDDDTVCDANMSHKLLHILQCCSIIDVYVLIVGSCTHITSTSENLFWIESDYMPGIEPWYFRVKPRRQKDMWPDIDYKKTNYICTLILATSHQLWLGIRCAFNLSPLKSTWQHLNPCHKSANASWLRFSATKCI